MARFEVPEGWCVQAFRFTLDPTEDQAARWRGIFGARRKAYNWAVATLKADIEAWRVTGIGTVKPSLRVLRKRWNTVKDRCVSTPRPGRCGGRSARKRLTPTALAALSMRTGTGRTPDPVNVRARQWASPVQEERPRSGPRDIHDRSDARRT